MKKNGLDSTGHQPYIRGLKPWKNLPIPWVAFTAYNPQPKLQGTKYCHCFFGNFILSPRCIIKIRSATALRIPLMRFQQDDNTMMTTSRLSYATKVSKNLRTTCCTGVIFSIETTKKYFKTSRESQTPLQFSQIFPLIFLNLIWI